MDSKSFIFESPMFFLLFPSILNEIQTHAEIGLPCFIKIDKFSLYLHKHKKKDPKKLV